MNRQGQMRDIHKSSHGKGKEVYVLINSTCESKLATLTIMVILRQHQHYCVNKTE